MRRRRYGSSSGFGPVKDTESFAMGFAAGALASGGITSLRNVSRKYGTMILGFFSAEKKKEYDLIVAAEQAANKTGA